MNTNGITSQYGIWIEKYSEVDNTSNSINLLVCQKALWLPHGKILLSYEFQLK